MRAATLVTGIALAAAGCGGGGGPLTQAEFAQRANETCKAFEAKIDALGTPETMEQLAAYGEDARDIFDEGLADLRDLEPPEAAADDYDKFLQSGDEARKRLDELIAAAKDGDEAEIGRIADQAGEEDEQADELARRIGLTDCAND